MVGNVEKQKMQKKKQRFGEDLFWGGFEKKLDRIGINMLSRVFKRSEGFHDVCCRLVF